MNIVNEIFSKNFLKHLIIAFLVFCIVGYIFLQLMNVYTSHGESVTIPDLRGLQKEEAEALLSEKELFVELIDSVFLVDKTPGEIVEQMPHPEEKIKKGRKIYVIINSKIKKKIPLPDVQEMSYRQAQSVLQSVGLSVASLEPIVSEYKDLVQHVKFNGRIIETGHSVEVGSALTLMVGSGLSEEQIHLPSFRGLTLAEAKQKSQEILIHIGSIRYDEHPTSEKNVSKYFVYKQSPLAGTKLNLGKHIDIWLTTDKSKLDVLEEIQISEDYDIENFF